MTSSEQSAYRQCLTMEDIQEVVSSPDIPPPLPPKTRKSSGGGQHVVKIRINDSDIAPTLSSDGCIRINVGGTGGNLHPSPAAEGNVTRGNNTYGFYYTPFISTSSISASCNSPYIATNAAMLDTSSGQSSPSDTLDSGTCSDLEAGSPPPNKPPLAASTTAVTVTVNGSGGGRNHHHHHHRTASLTSSGAEMDSDDNISCDSLNSGDDEVNKDGPEQNGVHYQLNSNHRHVDEMSAVTVMPTLPERRHTNVEVILNSNQPISLVHNMADAQTLQSEHTDVLNDDNPTVKSNHGLPQGLLQDIRGRTAKLSFKDPVRKADSDEALSRMSPTEPSQNDDAFMRTNSAEPVKQNGAAWVEPRNGNHTAEKRSSAPEDKKCVVIEERTYADRNRLVKEDKLLDMTDTDSFYDFHINEGFEEEDERCCSRGGGSVEGNEDSFAGYKNLLENRDASSTIRSAKGTVRGVKNRVRAGIATFLQLHATKSYKEKEAGTVVVYTTTMGIVRDTYHECLKVKKILRNLLVKFEERDVFMSREVQAEIKERMDCEVIIIPQVFVEGQHIGDSETVERLNETGELRRILKPFKSRDACSTCQVCGGHRLLPCAVCKGSKKSVHRNDFTAEFVSLKCMHCDEVGLVRCYAC